MMMEVAGGRCCVGLRGIWCGLGGGRCGRCVLGYGDGVVCVSVWHAPGECEMRVWLETRVSGREDVGGVHVMCGGW